MFTAKRNCPNCGKELVYTSKIAQRCANYNMMQAETKNTSCNSCSMKQTSSTRENPNKGKGFYYWWVKKYGKDQADIMQKEYKIKRQSMVTPELRKTLSDIEKERAKIFKNGMSGRSFYDVWVEKYGKDIADQKLIDHKQSLKDNARRGNKNPQFGKPAPIGSGNGWSGWYNSFYFRSLIELSYAVFLDSKNILWISAEKISIPYINERGEPGTYRADFIVNDKYMIELKPKFSQNYANVLLKKRGAEQYCKEHNLIYKIKDFKILDFDKIVYLVNSGQVKFLDKYQERFEKKKNQYEKNNYD